MEKFSGPLSRRYGTALFESISEIFISNKEEFAKASEEIRILSKSLNKNSIQVFKNQALSYHQKQEFLKSLIKTAFHSNVNESFSQCLFNFLSLVIKNKRFSIIHSIFDFYLNKSDEYLDIVRANIISANKMSQNTIGSFEYAISHSLQKRVVFSNFIDESLQCGFVIKIGSIDIDASLKSFLAKLKESVH